jgi:hypothetical protein
MAGMTGRAMAKESRKPDGKKLTPQQRQLRLGIRFALRNMEFSNLWYPNGEPDWTDHNARREAANNVLAFNMFSETDDEHSHMGEVALIFDHLSSYRSIQ